MRFDGQPEFVARARHMALYDVDAEGLEADFPCGQQAFAGAGADLEQAHTARVLPDPGQNIGVIRKKSGVRHSGRIVVNEQFLGEILREQMVASGAMQPHANGIEKITVARGFQQRIAPVGFALSAAQGTVGRSMLFLLSAKDIAVARMLRAVNLFCDIGLGREGLVIQIVSRDGIARDVVDLREPVIASFEF